MIEGTLVFVSGAGDGGTRQFKYFQRTSLRQGRQGEFSGFPRPRTGGGQGFGRSGFMRRGLSPCRSPAGGHRLDENGQSGRGERRASTADLAIGQRLLQGGHALVRDLRAVQVQGL